VCSSDLGDMDAFTYSMAQMILAKSFMQGVVTLMSDANEGESNSLMRWASNLGASLAVPAVVSQFPLMNDPYIRKAKGVVDQTKARTPFLRQTLDPSLDVYGEPIENARYKYPTPLGGKEVRADPLNNWLLKMGRGLRTDLKKLEGLPLAEKQDALRERKDYLREVMETSDGDDVAETKKRISSALSSWTRNYVNPLREDLGLNEADALVE